jgi:hypothetical protein
MSLSQRLLNTSFPILEPEIRLLQIAVEELGDRFVQAVALACESPIEQIPEIWRKSISHRLPYSDLPAQADPLYSFGVEQIVLRHQHDYGQQLKQVQGFLTSDLKTANDPG